MNLLKLSFYYGSGVYLLKDQESDLQSCIPQIDTSTKEYFPGINKLLIENLLFPCDIRRRPKVEHFVAFFTSKETYELAGILLNFKMQKCMT